MNLNSRTHVISFSVFFPVVAVIFALTISLFAQPIPMISIENNLATGFSFMGLTADKKNSLGISIFFPTERNSPIKAKIKSLGFLTFPNGTEIFATSPVRLSGSGKLDLIFHPPAYLASSSLSEQVVLSSPSAKVGTNATSSIVWAARTGIEIQSGKQVASISILLFRPPIIMVHGFAGDRSSLEHFEKFLKKEKFHTLLEEYYNKVASEDSSIETQASKLENHVRRRLLTYSRNNIKTPRLDIVSHSMGGLISRYFVLKSYPTATYTPKIRKIIMLGSPNHGVCWFEKKIGNILANYISKRHQKAANQLYSGDKFYKFVNAGETDGKHLHPDIQYALLIARRKLYSHFDISDSLYKEIIGGVGEYAADDGVVPQSSANLNGVASFVFQDVMHTYSNTLSTFFPKDKPLTRYQEAWNLTNKLLLEDIPRFPLVDSSISIRRGEGDIFFRASNAEPWFKVATFPTAFDKGWGEIQVYKGRALVGFNVKGRLWATVALNQGSLIRIDYAAPDLLRAFIKQGMGRFMTHRKGSGKFEVILGKDGPGFLEFSPIAKVVDLDTEFLVDATMNKVFSVEGRLFLKGISEIGTPSFSLIPQGSGIHVKPNGNVESVSLPLKSWWEDDFFKISDEEIETGRFNPNIKDFEILGSAIVNEAGKTLSLAGSENSQIGRAKEIFIRFDLDPLNLDREAIRSASLELTLLPRSGETEGLEFFSINSSFEPKSFTWAKGSKHLGSISLPPSPSPEKIRFDLTNYFLGVLSGRVGNFGLFLQTRNRKPAMISFASSEHPEKSFRPAIIIKFKPEKTPSFAGFVSNSQDNEKQAKPLTHHPKEVTEEMRKSYDEYCSAFLRLTALINEGKGETKELQEARDKYKKARANYQNSLDGTSKEP